MGQRLYDSNMYRFCEPQPSYWEATGSNIDIAAPQLAGNESCDVVIIGGGYTGLSAAYHLVRDYRLDVRVLEAGHIGWGASGRNGGFCGIGGSKMQLRHELSVFGREHVRHYYQSQIDAVNLVAQIIRSENIDSPLQGDCELEAAHSPSAYKSLRQRAAMQFRLLGLDTEAFSAEQFRERFFDSSEQYGGIRVRPTFGLHPLRFVAGLANAAVSSGANLHANSEVLEWTKTDGAHLITTAAGVVRANRVVMATNGFMPEHLRQEFFGVPLPMLSAIVVTRELHNDELAAYNWQTENPAINSRELMNYFRLLPDRRFMFGGRGHTSGTAAAAAQVFDGLQLQLARLWPLWSRVEIDYRWHGLICMTRRMTPCVGRLEDDASVYFGFGYHGNGVNTSTWAGKQIADWLGSSGANSNAIPDSLPVMVRGLSPKFPLPSMRLKYLQLALAWKRLQDWSSQKKSPRRATSVG